MSTIQDELFAQPDGQGWCDFNGGIPNKQAPPIKYILSSVNTESQPFLGGTLPEAQYVKDVVDGEVITTSYHDVEGIKQFDSEIEAITWLESKGIIYEHSGYVAFTD